jgi:Na+/phosphate symporter
MSGFNYIGQSIIKEIASFYAKNADLDASGTIDMAGLMRASKRMELFLKEDFKTLWEMERSELEAVKTEMKTMERDYNHTIINIEESYQEKLQTEIHHLQRSLYVMTRCAKHLSAVARKRVEGGGGEVDDEA